MPKSDLDELERSWLVSRLRRDGRIAPSPAYLPERWMTAAEISDASGTRSRCSSRSSACREAFAAPDKHVSVSRVRSDSSHRRDERRSRTVDAVRLLRLDVARLRGLAGGAVDRAPAGLCKRTRLSTRTSRGGPMALRLARNYLVGRPLRKSLVRRRSRERTSRLGERALAFHVQLARPRRWRCSCSATRLQRTVAPHAITDGSLTLQVKGPSGGSVDMNGGYGSSTSPTRPR